jgi:diadenosine tetraphosphate (Ap4A) HIT family hydrolase
MLAARTVNELYRPTKMNYEIHGNTIPHLHLHLYPRFADDPYVGRPIDGRLALFTRSPEELGAIREAFAPLPRLKLGSSRDEFSKSLPSKG